MFYLAYILAIVTGTLTILVLIDTENVVLSLVLAVITLALFYAAWRKKNG
jgi:hypothetical protein